jgi:hypothetical protein
VDEAQHLTRAEEGKRGDLLAALALIQPAKSLQTAEALLGGRAVHGHAHFIQSRVLQVQLHAPAGHPHDESSFPQHVQLNLTFFLRTGLASTNKLMTERVLKGKPTSSRLS